MTRIPVQCARIALQRFALLLIVGSPALTSPLYALAPTGWVAHETPAGSLEAAGTRLRIDSQGNAYVLGTRCTLKSGSACVERDWVLAKFGPAGARLLEVVYDPPDPTGGAPVDFEFDPAGNLVVFGSTGDGPRVAKYTSDGQELWSVTPAAPPEAYVDPADVAIDDQGNVYVAGASSFDSDLTLISYDSSGAWRWTRAFDDVLSNAADSVALRVTPDGRARLAANYTDRAMPAGDTDDFFVLQYTPGGSVSGTWEYDDPGEISMPDVPSSMDMNDSLAFAITGRTGSTTSTTARFDAAGSATWVVSHASRLFSSLRMLPSGDLYLLGRGSGILNAFLIARHTSTGAPGWERSYAATGFNSVQGIALDLTPDAGVAIAGFRAKPSVPGSRDLVTALYDGSGNLLWDGVYGSPAGGNDDPVAIATGPDGSLHVLANGCVSVGAGGDCLATEITLVKYAFCADADTDGACNPIDPDDDNDGVADALDCAPLDPAWSAPPSEIVDLEVSTAAPTAMTCATAGTGVRYDFAGGLLSQLAADGGSAGAVCLLDDAEFCTFEDLRPDPAPGDGYYYLVRGAHACLGTYGAAAGGAERLPVAACP